MKDTLEHSFASYRDYGPIHGKQRYESGVVFLALRRRHARLRPHRFQHTLWNRAPSLSIRAQDLEHLGRCSLESSLLRQGTQTLVRFHDLRQGIYMQANRSHNVTISTWASTSSRF